MSLSLFVQEVAQLHMAQQESLAILELAAYTTDAMRVLMVLERHADTSTALDDMLKTICPDWRNPGATNDPADLLFVVLSQVVRALQKNHAEMDRVVASM